MFPSLFRNFYCVTLPSWTKHKGPEALPGGGYGACSFLPIRLGRHNHTSEDEKGDPGRREDVYEDAAASPPNQESSRAELNENERNQAIELHSYEFFSYQGSRLVKVGVLRDKRYLGEYGAFQRNFLIPTDNDLSNVKWTVQGSVNDIVPCQSSSTLHKIKVLWYRLDETTRLD
jgi:hypothetical protein